MRIDSRDGKKSVIPIGTKVIMDYQILLSEVLAGFIQGLQGTDEPIRKGFERIGKYLGVDRIGLILFSADGFIASETVYWNSEKWIYDDSAEFHFLTEFPWLMRQLRGGQMVMIENFNEFPSSAFSEKEYLENYGIRTFVARPLTNGKNSKVVGFWHLDATADKNNLDDTKLELLSNLEEALAIILQVKVDIIKTKATIVEKDILLNNTDIQMWYMLNPAIYGSVNKAHASFFGKTCEEMILAEIHSVFEMQVANEVAEITLKVFEKKSQISREISMMNLQNEERIFVISWNPILDDKHEVLHVICSAHDITDLKKTQKLLAANRELATLNEKFIVINTELVVTNDKLLHINKELEKEIIERKLVEERLEKAYNELKNAQIQIVQQEKMASIGQLAAGVAHEINNPMGFIISNLSSLKGYTDKIIAFLKEQDETVIELSKVCGEKIDNEMMTVLFQKLQVAKRSQKIDYIMGDTKDLIKETQEGAERVKKIVQDLKGFARVTIDDTMNSDINAGLESTINIIWNELKYKTTLEKDFGVIPLVKCNLGQLNQVFMNILLNAVQAIDTRGEIRIKTWTEDNNIFVSIADTGCGMSSEVVNRIFEPFFTTKEVGKGTGLGLSVSYEIIKKHGGEIKVDSKPKEGTTFTVKIPVEENAF